MTIIPIPRELSAIQKDLLTSDAALAALHDDLVRYRLKLEDVKNPAIRARLESFLRRSRGGAS
jgi:hypothetical protein